MLSRTFPGKGWIQMAPSGFFASPTALEPDDVIIEDVAHHLARICRFTGGTTAPYSVAQHSVFVSDELKRAGFNELYQLAGLLHDASEAYIGDFAGPLKHDDALGPAFRAVEDRIQAAVEEHFGLPAGASHWKPVKAADTDLLNAEGYWLMPHNDWAMPSAYWLGRVITPWPHWLAQIKFLSRFNVLAGALAV